MDTQDTREKIIRIETTVEHIEAELHEVSERQKTHELSTATSLKDIDTRSQHNFSEIRENAIRLQYTTENLVKAIESQNTRMLDWETRIKADLQVRLETAQRELELVKKDISELKQELSTNSQRWLFSTWLGRGLLTVITTPSLIFIFYWLFKLLGGV